MLEPTYMGAWPSVPGWRLTRRLKILRHAHCFDGMASASLFARFYEERIDPEIDIVHVGKTHARGPVYDDHDFDADVHAIVDFRYAADDRLDWWFDHHASAFQPKEERAHFARRAPDHFFFDEDARSCTKFLAESLTRVYAWEPRAYAELIDWADIIDGAQFESAAQATDLSQAALQVMTFVEHNDDPTLATKLMDAVTRQSLASLADEPFIIDAITPVIARQRGAARVIAARLRCEAGIASFDLGDEGVDDYNKFIPYVIAPDAHYVVAVTASETRTKVSVGSNPWNRPSPLIHLAQICERYGGGGHAVVGAITLPGGALPEARRIAAEITDELRRQMTKEP